MGKTRLPWHRTRPKNKRLLSWVVIDIAAFTRLREAGWNAGTLPADHDGRCLEALESRVVVARVDAAWTEAQTRLFASNGGSAAAYQDRKIRGERFSQKYRNRARYAVAEKAVYDYLKAQRVIGWNIPEIRYELYRLHGDEFLHDLDASLFPSQACEMSDAALSRWVGRRNVPFRIVDTDEYRRLRSSERASRAADLNGGGRTHDGSLLARATVRARISATKAYRAIEIFRDRVQGGMNVLPHGRFVAIPECDWADLIRRSILPEDLTQVADASAAAAGTAEPLALTPLDADGIPPPRRSRTRIKPKRSKTPVGQRSLPFGS